MHFSSLAVSLYRTYFNLSEPLAPCPFHVYAPDFAFRALIEDSTTHQIQAVLMPSFREELMSQSEIKAYSVDDPRNLPRSLRTKNWELLCEKLDDYHGLDDKSKALTLGVLAKLGFYQLIIKQSRKISTSEIENSADLAQQEYLRVLTKYVYCIDEGSEYDIAEFRRIAEHAPVTSLTRVNATYQMVVQHVKHYYDQKMVIHWLPILQEALEKARPHLTGFTYLALKSRYHRVAGFLPQMLNNSTDVIREMDLAEEFARQLPRNSFREQIAADEMLFPVLESRIKEALWLKNLDLAEERASLLVNLSPSDPRPRLHIGEVLLEQGKIEEARNHYRLATRLGPPSHAIAWFMIGQCSEELDDLEQACDAYLTSIRYDSMAISALEKLAALSIRLNNNILSNWCTERLASLNQLFSNGAELHGDPFDRRKAQPYQVKQVENKSAEINIQ